MEELREGHRTGFLSLLSLLQTIQKQTQKIFHWTGNYANAVLNQDHRTGCWVNQRQNCQKAKITSSALHGGETISKMAKTTSSAPTTIQGPTSWVGQGRQGVHILATNPPAGSHLRGTHLVIATMLLEELVQDQDNLLPVSENWNGQVIFGQHPTSTISLFVCKKASSNVGFHEAQNRKGTERYEGS